MTHAEREAALLVKLTRLRAKVEDVREELLEAGLERTANLVLFSLQTLDTAKQTLMSAIRESGEAAGRKR